MSLFDSIWSDEGGSSGFGSGDPSNTSSSPAYGSFGGDNTQANLGAGIGAAGVGLDIFSKYEQAQAEKQVTASNIAIAGLEQQMDEQRKLAMQVNYRRQVTEQLRKTQQASSLALAVATNQGAAGNAPGQSSGLAGAQGQIAAEGAYNQLGLNQNYQISMSMFSLDEQINAQRIAQFQAQSSANTWGAIAGIGGDIAKSAGTLAQFAMFV